jgi:hypothetical protein
MMCVKKQGREEKEVTQRNENKGNKGKKTDKGQARGKRKEVIVQFEL